MNTPIPEPSLASRLVTLSDGRPGLRAGISITAESPCATGEMPNPTGPILDFISSDETLDRYGEIISASGWRLDHYLKNPVFQNAHQYGDIVFTLGKALMTELRTISGRQVLFQRIEFAVDANPIARVAYDLYRGKFLNAVSVGFIPMRWADAEASAKSTVAPSLRRKYLEQELIEVSAVSIPANPGALQLALKSGAVAKADLAELVDFIRLLEDRSKPSADSSLSGIENVPVTGTPLMRLAREIRNLIREN